MVGVWLGCKIWGGQGQAESAESGSGGTQAGLGFYKPTVFFDFTQTAFWLYLEKQMESKLQIRAEPFSGIT